MPIQLPATMQYVSDQMRGTEIPSPTPEIDIRQDASPTELSAAIVRIGGWLGYLEYMLGNAEAMRSTLHDSIEYALGDAILDMDGKLTLKVRESQALRNDATLRESAEQRTAQTALQETVKGWRNAYKAQYDALSRMLAARQLEAELARH